MRLAISKVAVLGLVLLTACKSQPNYNRPLPFGARALIPLDSGESPPDFARDWNRRDEILPALERSITWTQSDHARQYFPIAGVTWERARWSLERFAELLRDSRNPREFSDGLARDFQVLKSAGWDGRGGGVLFTGYYTPILPGSLVASSEFRYPLYAMPPDLVKGAHGEILGRAVAAGVHEPYPTREAIEAGNLLSGRELELIWLRDPLDAFIAHVNGSAFVELQSGGLARFGYSAKNGRAYTSLGHELVKDGYIERDEVSLFTIRDWAREHPELVAEYLNRNESYVFFTPIEGNPRGSLNLEVSPGRTLATDKSLFPRGAVTWVNCELPGGRGGDREFAQFMLDQDTGGAIRTAGRGDLYLGVGDQAEAVAGRTQSEGQLYYLFLRPERLEEVRRRLGAAPDAD